VAGVFAQAVQVADFGRADYLYLVGVNQVQMPDQSSADVFRFRVLDDAAFTQSAAQPF